MNRTRITALLVTATATLLLLLTLLCSHLTLDVSALSRPKQPVAEIAEIDEEFVDLLDMAYGPSDPSPAYTPEESNNDSHAAQAAGSDLADAGEQGLSAPDVTTEAPSPVSRPKKTTPPKTGPKKKADEAEKAREKARKGISDAFKNTDKAPDNTTSAGSDKGDSGKPDAGASEVNGTGSGSVGGGWTMPRYAKVPTHLTGRIELTAKVNAQGRVTSVEFTGGKAPAGTEAALIERCKAEVRGRTFTRNDDNPPEESTARIIYNFR